MKMEMEKVIKGLNHCFHGQECCGDAKCPYYIEHMSDSCCLEDCQKNLKADAVAMLKEQETIIQSLKDIIRFNEMILPDITNFSEIGKLYKVFSPLNEQRAVKPHTESAVYDIGSWWYVCGACQQPIDKTDIFCRHCGKKVKWE